ncbi:hypothetical protein RP75_21670 [Agrobacterium arsenijevicii]|uniref:Transposase n=1 Tax=Agrobacterium arsenijevicii TaxID=1585697 RepID=A0ABR5D2S7_9HYPH|nr:hypothetical protein RP75_21670 [Agrobacterium arsenijevicii]
MSLPLDDKLMKMTRKRRKCSTRPQKSLFQSVFAFLRVAKTLQLFVLLHFRTENRGPLFLEML